jgi:catechol 2,3-dioxygenase-like lactoylglutathione lyase family enzyme
LLTYFSRFWSGVLCIAATLAVLPGAAFGQASSPGLAGIAHAAIRVSDLTKSRDFYERLGFEEAFSLTKEGTPTESFLKINDRQFIELYPQREPSQVVGFMHVCFESADLNALNQEYVARGLSPTPVKRAGAGNLLFTMEGPEKQNIEYTQYMPDSMHTKDRGKHLGANRISEKIVGLSVEMNDPAAAQGFYEQKLGFRTVPRGFEAGSIALELPGNSGEEVEITQRAAGSAFRLLFGVGDLKQTAKQLKARDVRFDRHRAAISIADPDGNRIIFVKVKPQ